MAMLQKMLTVCSVI